MKKINWDNEFNKHSLKDWEQKALKEVKNDKSKLSNYDTIEEIKSPIFFHKEQKETQNESPGNFPYTRGYKSKANSWTNGLILDATNEKIANKKALDFLMNGVDFLYFNTASDTNWLDLFKEIELKHIYSQFNFSSFEDSLSLIKHLQADKLDYIAINHDIILYDSIPSEILDFIKKSPFKIFLANGYKLQQCGANSWQEIAYILSCSHEMLVNLMRQGLSVDQAAACIHCSVGIGANYFIEIAKIRTLRTLWSEIIKAYEPKDEKSYEFQITAHIGLMNKSLKDPYTNILRQTTESMSALIGGVNHLLIHPYDEMSTEGASDFTTKIGINISLILKEESKFDISKDPLGGSYLIEELSELLSNKAWRLFQQLDEFKCIMSDSKKQFINDFVSKKAKQRLAEINQQKRTLIGINSFLNPEKLSKTKNKETLYLGLKELNYESIC
mgnify:CR=1 FL=1